MRLEDMKKDIPETPEFIHTMIQSEVKKQLQDTKLVNIHTRRVKIWTGARGAAAIAVCVLATSTVTSQADAISDAGAFVSEDQDSAEFTSEETLTDSNDNFTDSSSGKLFGRTSSDSSETSPGGPALSTDISPEASEGSWASSGSNWMFLVDDKPYTGWFTDTDGKQYYMDETGIMQTGWTDIGKKRYYFDMDGILQTGTVNNR